MTALHPIARDYRAKLAREPRAWRSRAAVLARHAAAFRLWLETAYSTAEIARQLGFSDASSVSHAVLAHARRKGRDVARIADLRTPRRKTHIDRTRFAFLFAAWLERQGLSQTRGAEALAISRTVLGKISRGQPIDDDSLVAVLTGTGISLADIALHGKRGRNRHEGQREGRA